MDVIVYSTHKFEREFLEESNGGKHNLKFVDIRLNKITALLGNMALGVSISVIVGILAGFIPAWSASKMSAVDAIRSK